MANSQEAAGRPGGCLTRWGGEAWEGAGRGEGTGTPVGGGGGFGGAQQGEGTPSPQSVLTSGFHLSSSTPVPLAVSKREWLLIRPSRNDRNSPASSALGSGSHCRPRPRAPILGAAFPCSSARPFGAGAVSPHLGTCDPWWVWGVWPSPPAGCLLHR